MSISTAKAEELKALCRQMRRELVEILYKIQTGHPGGSLSCCELLATLYFHQLRVDPQNPNWEERDRFILSKGHAAPMLYLCLAHRGFFPLSELDTLRQAGSRLQGHPCLSKTPGVELSTGPLGLGLSAGVGMAEALRLQGRPGHVYVLLGDGELQEGCVWEAAMTASKYKPPNLTAIVDCNGVQLDGTNDEVMPLGDIAAKFTAFGWQVIDADGHDIPSVASALEAAEDRGPALVLARTVKGKDVSFMEGRSAWHGRPISEADYIRAIQELGGGTDG